MAHLEAFWHPWHDKMSGAQQALFKKSMPNQAHQQVVLDQVWNVEFDSDNAEILVSFSFIPSPEALIALEESGFIYNGYKMVKRMEEDENIVRMCDSYAKSI